MIRSLLQPVLRQPVQQWIRRRSDSSGDERCIDWAPRSLREPEEDFFLLVEEGNVHNLRLFMEKHKRTCGTIDFDANCVNFENTNAMSIAIERGDWKMAKYLMTVMSVSVRRVLMEAIHQGDMVLVKNLCEEMGADCESNDDHYCCRSVGEPDFSTNTTPLMLAAMESHFEIIGYLIDRGHTIQEPHPPGCLCEHECEPTMKFHDPLNSAIFTLNVYTALSNPSYFVYVTGDPFHYAFKIHRRLMTLSKLERPFNRKYGELAKNVREFAARLIAECRNSGEVELVLKQRCTPTTFLTRASQNDYPRLLMAMDYAQKEFVTQPNVQIFVQEKFHGTFHDWKYYSNFAKVFFPLLRILTLPAAFFNVVVYPSSKMARFYAAPLNRMLHFLATYTVFLIIIFMETRRDKPRVRYHPMNSILTPMICVYFCGLSAGVVHQILYLHPRRFFSCGWNIFDVVMLSMFALSISFEAAAAFHVLNPNVKFSERKYWSKYDPQLFSEGFKMIASVMAYLKLMFFFQAHSVVGPLQIALGKMIKDCARYSTFAVIILLAYTTAFSKYYSYYSGMRFKDPVSNDVSTQEESFIDWISSFKTFFWAIFTQSDPDSADIILENVNHTDPKSQCCRTNEHLFTQFVGYLGLGTFSLLVVMIIVNMLIATMTETHANILGDVHRSWLYGRTVIYIYFMNYPVLPPPLNLFPHFYRVVRLREEADSERACQDRGRDLERDYNMLARALVKRYFETLKRQNHVPVPHSISDSQVGIKIGDSTEIRCRSL